MHTELEALRERLGYDFRDKSLLRRALTHKSRVFEKTSPDESTFQDNEQFEFLGDSVLGMLVSEHLFRSHPEHPEGRLSKLKAHLVSANHLHAVARELNLGEFLLLGRGEEMSGGREKRALLANAVEALIAALFLDAGIEEARRFVLRHVIGSFDGNEPSGEQTVVDYKSALQELAQSLKLPQPRYAIVKEQGPEHSKTFVVEARVGRDLADRAEGFSKKSAGQRAAELLLQQLIELERRDQHPE